MRLRNRNVFINCPFDDDYQPLFRAICFTALCCGFHPRSALEVIDSGHSRLEKITRLIAQCDLGIHDISRTELTPAGLPRFNMPFELGLTLGCKYYGGAPHNRKQLLILDRDPFRYRAFLSDLSGHDPESHHGHESGAITAVRNWLQSAAGEPMRGPLHIEDDFRLLQHDLPTTCAALGFDDERLPFPDLMLISRAWLREWEAAISG